MSRLTFDQTGQRFYETGVDQCVLYPYNTTSNAYDTGVAWNGITSIQQTPSGGEATPLYADNIKYLNLRGVEEFGATIEAYTYPDEFAVLDGSASPATGVIIGQQKRGMFGLCYRTKVGNDVDGEDHGYKLHFVYGAVANPSDRQYETINDSPDGITFSWEMTTTPVPVRGYKPVSHLEVDSRKISEEKLTELEGIVLGTDAADGVEATAPRLPLPDEIIALANRT